MAADRWDGQNSKSQRTWIQVLPMSLTCSFKSVLVTQSCPTLWDPKNCSLTGSSVHGILQARTLNTEVIPFSRGSSPPRDQTQVSCIIGRFFTNWTTRETQKYIQVINKYRIGNNNPLKYSCLGIPVDRGAWWATVHGVTKSRTQLSTWGY